MKKMLVLLFVAIGMASLTGCRGGIIDRIRNRGDACSPYATSGGCGLFDGNGLFGRRQQQQYVAVPVPATVYANPTCGTDAGCGTDATCGTDLGCGTDVAPPCPCQQQCNHGCSQGDCHGHTGCSKCNTGAGECCPHCGHGDAYSGIVEGGIVDGGIVGGFDEGYIGQYEGGVIDGQIIDGEIIGETTLPGPDFSSEAPALPTVPSESATQ